jgi:hypothetical protein
MRFHAISCRDAVSVTTPSRSMTTASKSVRESLTTAFTATSALRSNPGGTLASLMVPVPGPGHKVEGPPLWVSKIMRRWPSTFGGDGWSLVDLLTIPQGASPKGACETHAAQ